MASTLRYESSNDRFWPKTDGGTAQCTSLLLVEQVIEREAPVDVVAAIIGL